MGSVTKDIQVDVPISVAYNQWTQFEDFPAFMSGVKSITQLDDRKLHWEVSVGGVEREFDAEIVEQHPDERIAWNSTGGKVHAGVVTFYRISDDSTKITLQVDWEPEGFVEKAGEILQIDDLQISKDLAEFKRLIESNGFESGKWRGEVPRAEDELGR
ncbi:polyketide cyclase/dehydrase/lipid transport protein [Rhodoglobus vestalii]|uniref:Polyketide cyclase/dehydrase/lipid transport protein n=1 Tax=Rhodoglobus vestalii TaxID=193384 RepID=A0A8H2KA22_9MICO|nr:SRPBCC family protein [Rhodoglobus vestalii]TQO19456.1 polyketide cyclase/dehydrase/lipid transport protein [Rhodoglobus vestalii]